MQMIPEQISTTMAPVWNPPVFASFFIVCGCCFYITGICIAQDHVAPRLKGLLPRLLDKMCCPSSVATWMCSALYQWSTGSPRCRVTLESPFILRQTIPGDTRLCISSRTAEGQPLHFGLEYMSGLQQLPEVEVGIFLINLSILTRTKPTEVAYEAIPLYSYLAVSELSLGALMQIACVLPP